MAHTMKRPRFKSVKPLNDFKIQATFIDDSVYVIDFKPFFNESKGLDPLKDPSVFGQVAIDEWGWVVEWEALDIQIGADTLWLDAQAQNAPDENTRIFAQWRARHGLSLADAASALGMTTRTMSAYGSGKRPVPRYIALACKGWEAEQL
jgi:DNA-binding XRE family transcriptional regulator